MTELHEISIDVVKDHEYIPKTFAKFFEKVSPNLPSWSSVYRAQGVSDARLLALL